MQPNITIRPATAADMPAIHQLVYALAVYEKEPEAVVTTPAEFLEDFQLKNMSTDIHYSNKIIKSIVREQSEHIQKRIATLKSRSKLK